MLLETATQLPASAISMSPTIILQQTLHDRAVHDESGGSKRCSAWPGQQPVFNEPENVKLLAELRAMPLRDCVLGPFKNVKIPQRAVVEGDRWDAPESVVGTVSI
jgi:hypothetical protein